MTAKTGICRSVPMGALVMSLGDKCGGPGERIRYSGTPTILELAMNDSDRQNNVGAIKVRYMITRK